MTVASVTRKGPKGRAHPTIGLISPSSHVLVKVVGATISASWSVTNTGGVTGLGHLDIFFPSTGTGFFGGDVSIPAGAAVTLSVSGAITSLAPGTYSGEVEVRASAPATVAAGGKHTFTLTISAGTTAPKFSVGQQVTYPTNSTIKYCGTITANQGMEQGVWVYQVAFTHPNIDPLANFIKEWLLEAGWNSCLL